MVEIPLPDRPGKLWVTRMPGLVQGFGVRDDLEAMLSFGIDRLVALVPEMDFADVYEVPDYLSTAKELFGDRFHLLEVVDYEVPADDEAFACEVRAVDEALCQGEQVVAHCGMGCGRTGLFAACLLVIAGTEPKAAVRTYRMTRGCGPETTDQVAYVVRFAQQRNRNL